MASTTRTLTVNVVGRTKNVEKAFKRVSKGSALMSDRLTKATRMAGIGFTALAGVAIGAAAALKPMIDKAASMEESLSKNNVVFGESAAAVEAFAATSLHAFGVTERAALEATGVIGTLGSALGMTEADSASMATTLVGLAGDMSSFNDASVEETLTAIQAGLRGESEPLRRFGVLLDAATLKAKALEKGIITSTKDALTPQTKALAAYELILEQTSIQMGDFTRTADSATNQSKLLAGEWDKIQTEIGTALLPAFTSIVTHLNEAVLPAVRQFWSDPSWYEGGVLAGEVLGSGVVSGATGFLKGLSQDEIDDLGWQDSWKASAELSALAAGASAMWHFISGARDTLESDPAQMALKAAFEAAGTGGAFDRPLRDDTTFAPGPTAAQLGSFDDAAAAPMPGGPFLGSLMGAIDAGKAIEGAFSPSESTVDVHRGDEADFSFSPEVAAFLKTLSPAAVAASDPAQRGGGTTINITSTAVSGQEVVEAIGKYVDGNGPLPPHWQQGAN